MHALTEDELGALKRVSRCTCCSGEGTEDSFQHQLGVGLQLDGTDCRVPCERFSPGNLYLPTLRRVIPALIASSSWRALLGLPEGTQLFPVSQIAEGAKLLHLNKLLMRRRAMETASLQTPEQRER